MSLGVLHPASVSRREVTSASWQMTTGWGNSFARSVPGSPRDEVGLPDVGSRRVKGLRREEVAVLAGVSVDYYSRLEQGRERTPSAQMMDNVPNAAAYIVNPAFRVLAANRTAVALIGPDQYNQPVRYLFLDPDARDYFRNWERVARAAVSGLRMAAGFSPPHPEVAAVVDGLRQQSQDFSALWDDHTAAGLTITYKKIHHRDVGDLELSYQTFDIRDAPGQQLVVATAPTGSPSADALALLGTLDATRRTSP